MIFGRKLNENLLFKNIPQILAVTIEFQGMGARSQKEVDLMKEILRDNDEIKALMPKTVSRNTQNMNLLPLVVILAHMMQEKKVKDPSFKENLGNILRLAPQHVAMMINVCEELNMANRQGLSPKKITARNFATILEFN